LAVDPDEDDVELDEQHESRLQPTGGRNRGNQRSHRQACGSDQRETGGFSGKRLWREPRDQVERRHKEGWQPRPRPAAQDPRERGEEASRSPPVRPGRVK
jgi:hypothetical protein